MSDNIIVSADYKGLYPVSFCIFNRVPCALWFSVVDGYYPTASVNHPFVPALKAATAVARACEFHDIIYG